jgi:hypothetical protein
MQYLCGKRNTLSLKQTGFQKWRQNLCHISVWIYGLGNKMDTIIPAALIAKHTLLLTSCNNNLWIDTRFSAEEYMLFWDLMLLLTGKKDSFLNRTSAVSFSPLCMQQKYKLKNSTFLVNVYHGICGSQTSKKNANASRFLHFIVMKDKHSFYVSGLGPIMSNFSLDSTCLLFRTEILAGYLFT